MKAMTLTIGSRQSVFDLAGDVRTWVSASASEYALVVRPDGTAALLTAGSRHAQMIAHDHPEQIAGVFSRMHDVATIRCDIQRWVDAGAFNQRLGPIKLIEGRKSMWSGSMFKTTRSRAPRAFVPGKRAAPVLCPDHGVEVPSERDWRGRPVPGRCPQCVERNKAAIERLRGGR